MIIDFIRGNGGGSGSGYTLPTATSSRLGGVKIGSGIDVQSDGTISVSGGTGGISNILPAITSQAEYAAISGSIKTGDLIQVLGVDLDGDGEPEAGLFEANSPIPGELYWTRRDNYDSVVWANKDYPWMDDNNTFPIDIEANAFLISADYEAQDGSFNGIGFDDDGKPVITHIVPQIDEQTGDITGMTRTDTPIGAGGSLPVGYEAEDFTGDDGEHYGLAWIDGEREDTAYIVGIDGNRVVCYVGDDGVSDEYEARLYYFDDGYSDRGFVMGQGFVFGYYDGDDEFHPIFLEPGTYALEYENMTYPDDTFNGKVMNIRYGSGWGEDNLKTIAWKLEEYGTLYEKTPLFTITEKTCPVIDGYAELVLSYKENPSAPVPVGGYRIELSTSNPEDFTADDIDVLNDFFAAVSGDTSLAEGAYMVFEDMVYRLSNYAMGSGDGDFTFTYATNSYLEDVYIQFNSGEYSEGSHYENDLVVKEEVISHALNDLKDTKVESTDVLRIVKITQSDYDDLVLDDEVDPDTLYIIINNT